MVRSSNSSKGNAKSKKVSSVSSKMKKNKASSTSKLSAVLGPMDFYVTRTGTSTSSESPPPSVSVSSPSSPSSTPNEPTAIVTTETATTISSSTVKRGKNLRTKHANVCGETGIHDITSIIREWVETELDLIDEDVAYILKFFYDLIEERSFIFLASVIQDFYSAVGSRGDHEWKEAYNNVIVTIQNDLRADSALPQDLILPTFDL